VRHARAAGRRRDRHRAQRQRAHAAAAISAEQVGHGARALGAHRFVVAREALSGSIEIDGFCPASIARLTAGPVIDVALTPSLEPLGPAPVGFEAAFTIEVRAGCREALAGSLTWEVVSVEGGVRRR
jgi:hypothetical protein